MNRYHLSPHWYVFCCALSVAASVVLFRHTGHHDQYFFFALFMLAGLWAASFFFMQLRYGGQYTIDRSQTTLRLLQRAVPRYLVWLALFATGIWFYESHAYYRANDKTVVFLRAFFDYYVVLGIPYFMLTLKFKASRIEDFYDPAIRVLIMLRALAPRAWTQRRYATGRAWRRRYNRKVWLNLVMRTYFIPVMVVQVYNGIRDTIALLPNIGPGWTLLGVLAWITTILWLMDSLSASVGYSIESRWLENRSRSIDTTMGGWLICLYCYPPLNQVTGTVFPFAPTVTSTDISQLIIPSITVLIGLKLVEVILLSALVYCDLSLGPSGVNITFKKLQNRGPYGIVRHPATVCKLTFWWIQSFLFIPFWSWQFVLGQLMWNAVYILRALSEERHLSQFEEYREYKQQVRYRFIPGVI